MTGLVLAAILVSGGLLTAPGGEPEDMRVDVIEVNTVLNDRGVEQYTQVIFWVWSPDYRRHFCRGWYCVQGLDCYPIRQGGQVVAVRGDRRYWGGVMVRSWTGSDPERDNQFWLPVPYRAILR